MKKSTRGSGKPAKPVSAKTRAADDKLREELRNADMKKFDRALAKAIRPPNASSRSAKSP